MNQPIVSPMAKITLPQKLSLDFLEKKDTCNRFSGAQDTTQEQRVRIFDPKTDKTWGFVVVDNTRRGPGLGGIRMASDLTLEEVSRLSRVMTLKNSAACLPFGGGKSGIVTDPRVFNGNPGLKADLFGAFAEAIFALDNYIPAPDMGTDEQDIQIIYECYSRHLGRPDHMRGGAGRPTDKGGIPLDEWGLTAQGLFAAARTMEQLQPDFHIENSGVVIQGFGNVGSWAATKLAAAGAVIVGASDINAGLWNPQGLDVEELNSIRNQPGGLRGYTGAVERRFGPETLDWLLEAPCDLLVPAARPDAITAKNADRLQCRMILQGANTPSNKMTEYYLQNRRGILSLSDFIVNVGGVIGCAVELKMTADADYREKVLQEGGKKYLDDLIFQTVSRNVMEIHRRLVKKKHSDVIFREAAVALAEERLCDIDKDYWV